MESFFQTLTNTYFLAFLILMITLKITNDKIKSKKGNNTNLTPKLPPGPKKLPIIGNLHQLAGPLPHHRLRDLSRVHGDLMHLQLGELSHVIISSPEFASQIMKTHDLNFAQRPILLGVSLFDYKNIGFAPYGAYWRQLRRICTQELLSPASVRSLRPIRQEEVWKMIKLLHSLASSGETVNLSEKIFASTYSITAKAAFGRVCEDQEEFISTVNEGMKITGGLSISELFPSQSWLLWATGFKDKVLKNFRNIDELLERIVQAGRAKYDEMATDKGREKSLLDIFFDHQENGDLEIPLDTKNIKAVMLDMFIAGSDTSSTCMEWTMLELLKNPRVMAKAQSEIRKVFEKEGNVTEEHLDELTYLKMIIKESFRMHPPAPLLVPRESRGHCVINGFDIPAKTKVLVNAWSIGRDPRFWTEPEKFHPERFADSSIDFKGTDFELIPFGAGRRMCPGVSFAVADIELILAQLLFHFDWKLPDGVSHDDMDMTERFGITVRRKEELYAVPIAFSKVIV